MVLSFMSVCLVVWIIFFTHRKENYGVLGEANIVATAPLETVKEGGILSLHCQVWRQNPNQQMSISRRLGADNDVKLAVDKTILSQDKNYFLAHRKLKDGSDVYFLSITDVTRNDEGEYVCSLLQSSGWGVAKEDSVNIGVRYFPSESFPICDPTGPQRVMEGEYMTLNCSSEPGNPPVQISWERTGSTEELLHVDETNSIGVYSQITLTPKLSDQDAMFVCKIKSKYFSNKVNHKCTMGPLSVEPNPDIEWPVTTKVIPIHVTEPKYKYIPMNETTDECHEVCSEMTAESVFRWTIATVISGLLALVFLIFGIILLIRYCFALDEQHVPPQEEPRDMPDLGNVQYRIDGNRLYMTLERPSTSQQTEVVYQGGEVLERQYILAPPHAGEIDGSYIGTPSRSRDPEPPYLRTPVRRDSYTRSHESPIKGAEADVQYMENTTEDIDPTHLSYQGTPIRNSGTPSVSVHGTPTRMLMDKVLFEAQSEGYMGNTGRRESEGYISGPSRESERLIYGTPSRGDYDTRQRSLTPTLPPRRYKTHYV